MNKAAYIILCLLFSSCELFDNDQKLPSGDYATVTILGGSLRISRGSCESVDLGVVQRNATIAVINMIIVWDNVFPVEQITVHELPVVMSVNPTYSGGQANGLYHSAERWIELRCGMEQVIEAELYHAIAHKLGIWCWENIGSIHDTNLDCSPV